MATSEHAPPTPINTVEAVAVLNGKVVGRSSSLASSNAPTWSVADATLSRALPLLMEYTTKLNEFAGPSVSGTVGTKSASAVTASVRQYLNAAKKLAQFVSQRLNTAQDDLLSIELHLRLAEYEAALASAESRLR